MQVQTAKHVVGVFGDQFQAVGAAKALCTAGFPPQQIVLITRDWKGDELPVPSVDLQNAATEGALAGTVAGGSLGLAAGVLASLIPGIGLGALVLSVMGGAAGAAAGCYAGPFLALAMTEDEAKEHAEHIEQGRTVIVVRTTAAQERARSIMADYGAYDFSMAST